MNIGSRSQGETLPDPYSVGPQMKVSMRPHEKATAVLTGILQIRLQYLHVPLYICSMYLRSFNAGSLSSTSCPSCTCWLLTGCNFKKNVPTLSIFKFSLFQNKILAVLGEGSNNNILYFQRFFMLVKCEANLVWREGKVAKVYLHGDQLYGFEC